MPSPAPQIDLPFQPVEAVAGDVRAGVLFLCDHASNALPPHYGSLGLDPAQFARHIAYDIGAAAVTRALAAQFGAPALLTRFSRLLIDPNRGADDPTLVMKLSDGAIVPGNRHADAAEAERRRELYWRPYRDAIGAQLDAMCAAGPVPAIVSLHSFTPVWRGAPRPWGIALLWDRDKRMAEPLLNELLRGDVTVGDNEPYDGALMGDTLYEAGTRRGLAHVLIEVRQDLVATDAGARDWAARLGDALAPVLARPDVHTIEHHGSRAGACASRPRLNGRQA
ncbi:MAG: putative N-formylglutamate amidohydrolase [Hyphomicrobiales bacterium]|nr:putative N-formylglutamate amidohydrolase [Hyphomicrobiales bacterium]